MGTPSEILDNLERLAYAYPGQKLERQTLEVYLEKLADIPGYLLERAVDEHIKSSKWFPRVAELRDTAADLAHTRNFSSLPSDPVDGLRAVALNLEEGFYRDLYLDEVAWRKLAGAFELAGREYAAGHLRRKLHVFKHHLESELQEAKDELQLRAVTG